MKKIIILSIILIFLITGIGFAFQNEPDGFRGLKWGDAPIENMHLFAQSVNTQNSYYRKDDKLKIGNAEFSNIWYVFNLYSNQFYKVQLILYSKNNYNISKIILEGKFSEPTYVFEKKDYSSLLWIGEKTEINLYYNYKEHKGWLIIKSMKIHAEKPEDNKQKELEKAKEDF